MTNKTENKNIKNKNVISTVVCKYKVRVFDWNVQIDDFFRFLEFNRGSNDDYKVLYFHIGDIAFDVNSLNTREDIEDCLDSFNADCIVVLSNCKKEYEGENPNVIIKI